MTPLEIRAAVTRWVSDRLAIDEALLTVDTSTPHRLDLVVSIDAAALSPSPIDVQLVIPAQAVIAIALAAREASS